VLPADDDPGGRGLDVAAHEGGVIVAGWAVDPSAPPDAEDPPVHAWLARYDGDGTPDWSTRWDGVGDRQLVSGIAIAADGGIAVTGGVRVGEDDWDIWLARYEADGTLAWSETVAGPAGGEDQGVGITADATGLGFVAVGYVMLDDGTTDAWLRRFDASGAVQWETTHAGLGAGIDAATEVVHDPADDRFIVVGYETISPDDTDLWVAAYDTDGQPQWTFRHDEAGGVDRGQGIAVGDGGEVFVVGSAVVPGRTIDAWVGRLGPDGALQWRELYDGPASLGDGANDVAVDAEGFVLVAGHQFENAGKWDGWVRKLDGDGVLAWRHAYASPAGGDDVAAAIAADPSGDVFVVGTATRADGTSASWLRRLAG
jgi:hypothetical protein